MTDLPVAVSGAYPGGGFGGHGPPGSLKGRQKIRKEEKGKGKKREKRKRKEGTKKRKR